MKLWQRLVLVVLALMIFGGLLMLLPPVQERVFWRVDELRLRIFYALNPPEQSVFKPDAQVAAIVKATLTQMVAGTPLASATLTATSTPLPPDAPTLAPTATLAPLPPAATIDSVPYIDQHYGYNNCA